MAANEFDHSLMEEEKRIMTFKSPHLLLHLVPSSGEILVSCIFFLKCQKIVIENTLIIIIIKMSKIPKLHLLSQINGAPTTNNVQN